MADEEETGSPDAPPPPEPHLITDGRPPPAPAWPATPGPPTARPEPGPASAPAPGATEPVPNASAGPFPAAGHGANPGATPWPPPPSGAPAPGFGGPRGGAPLQSTYNTMGLGPGTTIEGYRQKHVGRGCFVALVIMAVAAIVGGVLLYNTAIGRESVSNLKVGTCIKEVEKGAKTVKRVSCDSPHAAEVAAKIDAPLTLEHCRTAMIAYLDGKAVGDDVNFELRRVLKEGETDATATKGYCLFTKAGGGELTSKIGP